MKHLMQRSKGFETIFPKKQGHSAFYFKVNSQLWFRVYKIDHLFSTVGEAHIFILYVSFRHLHRLKQLKLPDKKSITFDCYVDTGIDLLEQLKQKGKVDISFLFEG